MCSYKKAVKTVAHCQTKQASVAKSRRNNKYINTKNKQQKQTAMFETKCHYKKRTNPKAHKGPLCVSAISGNFIKI